MRTLKWGIVICMFVMSFGAVAFAEEPAYSWYNVLYMDNFEVRPEFGFGYSTSSGKSGGGYHVGARMLSNATATKRYGVEVSFVSPFGLRESRNKDNYLAVGIVLEQVLWKQFAATIGTLGYIGIQDSKNNPFGVVASFGWEPAIRENMRLFLGVRWDYIFDTHTIGMTSLQCGLKF